MLSSDEIVELNVGGVPFHTSRTTLCNSRSKGSMLCALASTDLPSRRDRHGRLFIDRDGARFRVVLNFLRSGTVHVVDGAVPCAETDGSVALTALLEEARFYALDELERVVKEEIDRLELEESLGEMDAGGKKDVACESPTSGRNAEREGVFESSPGLDRAVKDYQFTLDADF